MPRPPASDATRKAATPVTDQRIGGRIGSKADFVATEEPLQILAGGPGQDSKPVTVTMRTPGHDFELAVGFLWSEGVLSSPEDVYEVRYCEVPPDEPQRYNVVSVRARRPLQLRPRTTVTTAACGICGTASLDDLAQSCAVVPFGPHVDADLLLALPDRLRSTQRTFATTGGLHAAGLFALDGTLRTSREDVGRHNAVDKVIGRAVLDRAVPLEASILCISGRASFEIVQKAAMAGVAVVVAVSAPSSLAVDAARRLGVTLVGFVRDGTGNIYSHGDRVTGAAAEEIRPRFS